MFILTAVHLYKNADDILIFYREGGGNEFKSK